MLEGVSRRGKCSCCADLTARGCRFETKAATEFHAVDVGIAAPRQL